MKTIILFCFCFFSFSFAHALTLEEGADAPTRTIEDLIKEYIDLPKGATDWKLFSSTKSNSIETKDEDGLEYQYYKPAFNTDLKNLDGTEITLKGYIFPLDESQDQKTFLFGPFPLNCPFQYHVDPRLVVEVDAQKNPVTFDYEPVTIKGKLELVPDDPENSTFYRLKNARKI